MRPPRFSFLVARLRAEHLCRDLLQLAFALAVVVMLAGQTAALGGDIFRTAPASGTAGGGTSTGAGGTAAAPLTSTIDSAAQLQARALAAFNRTDAAIRAVSAAQQAARAAAAAAASSVPNGLQPGGLDPLDLSSLEKWKGAAAPIAAAGKPNEVTIVQDESQALLQWKTFNIGKDTTLTFDQSKGGVNAGQWVAFNFVRDPSAAPSQILGALKTVGAADAKGNVPVGGQVFVLNPNGILFGGTSQVNVHALVASSLPINANLVERGLLNNPDSQFLFSALALPAGANGTPAFDPAVATDFVPLVQTPGPKGYGSVVVAPGAQLTAPTSADHVGGRIALIGATVSNAGTIATPDGQTILAAGLQIGLAPHDSADPSLRGLDVSVGKVADASALTQTPAGTVTNNLDLPTNTPGLITAPRGSVVLAGSTVEQLGVIDSSTSVSSNGRIDLLANYEAAGNDFNVNLAAFFATKTGLVRLGANSVTRILPEWTSADKVVGSGLALISRINLQGLNIHSESGAALYAPGATVALDAGNWFYYRNGKNVTWNFQYEDRIADADGLTFHTGGQIYLDSRAWIDVSGTAGNITGTAGGGASASASDNVIAVELRGAELADSPLQRDGVLRGETMYVDIRNHGDWDPTLNDGKGGYKWIGTPLADARGYANLVQHTVGQLTTDGGTVTLKAGNSVVVQKGASVDVSGGWTDYAPGELRTTKLLSGGLVFDIAQATPDRKYDGIYTGVTTTTDAKWGVTQTTTAPGTEVPYDSGYKEGGKGGTLAIWAGGMALDGTLRGQTATGERQRSAPPRLGALSLNFESQFFSTTINQEKWHSLAAPKIEFRANPVPVAAGEFKPDAAGYAAALDTGRQGEVWLSPALVGTDGFGTVAIDNQEGRITVPAAAALTTVAGGSLSFAAANIDILGAVAAPGGSLAFKAFNYSKLGELLAPLNSGTDLAATPAPAAGRGTVTLGPKGSLSTAGLVVDDRLTAPSAGSLPLSTAGGSILVAGYNVDLQKGSAIDASGGVAIGATGKLAYGKGGSIDLQAGQDLTLPDLLGGTLKLGATLSGYSGGKGARLGLLAPSFQVGGTAPVSPTTLWLAPDFFTRGGFGSYSIAGLGETTADSDTYVPGFVLAAGTAIDAKQQSRFAVLTGTGFDWAFPDLPQGLRNPVNLAFSAVGATDPHNNNAIIVRGNLVLAAGAAIRTDPRGTVSLAGDTVTVDGSVSAPGGTITIAGAKTSNTLFDTIRARATVALGGQSSLSTRGAVVLQPKNAAGYTTGDVLDGGSISLSGNIVAQSGAVLDVSGTAGVVDRDPAYSGAADVSSGPLALGALRPTPIESNGGAIVLQGAQLLLTDATLRGGAGKFEGASTTSAKGGRVELSSGRFTPGSEDRTPLDVTLTVSQLEPAGLFDVFQGTATAPGGGAPSPAPVGGGFASADRLVGGDFDSIALKGTVQFAGPVTLSARAALAVGDAGVVSATDKVELAAPYVALGKSFSPPLTPGSNVSEFSAIVGGEQKLHYYFAPSYGTGSLTVTSTRLIDVGTLSLQGIGLLSLQASGGDLRGNGTVDVAGAIVVNAGQVYPPTAVGFTLAAYDYPVAGVVGAGLGSVTIGSSGTRTLPLSAGGQLNVYASTIVQGGVLRAPLGTINLGWDGSGTGPVDAITNAPVPVARSVTLQTGSTTSVSAVDPSSGKDLTLPYGVILNGTAWIDPRRVDITTSGGLPAKQVTVSGGTVDNQTGAKIDLSGGGDLYAYRWVAGNGGSQDILASASSFAVIPGYGAEYAPFAPYATATDSPDDGYVNASLKVGDKIRLEAGAGLAAGIYTLLPARYALLPGAVLVTEKSGLPPAAAIAMPEGTSLVAGYRFNGLDPARTGTPLRKTYEVAPQKVVLARAQYDGTSANTFFQALATEQETVAPRLPVDAGQVVFSAQRSMVLQGSVAAAAATGGRGGLVDISAPGSILIAGKATSAPAGTLVLTASDLSGFKAESLLVGGIRSATDEGTAVAVNAANVTLDNAGAPLSGADIILVARERLELAPGAELRGTGTLADAEKIVVGDAAVAGSGNGVLVRVGADATAETLRQGIGPAGKVVPTLVVGSGATIGGASAVLDSSSLTALDSSARLEAGALALRSGRISLLLDNPGPLGTADSLVLAGAALSTLQQSSSALSLQGYDSIDFYGTGQVGTLDAAGRPSVAGLALHAAAFRGFNHGNGTVSLAARDVLLDNVSGGSSLAAPAVGLGTLSLTADILHLGSGAVAVSGFGAMTVDAAKAVVAVDTATSSQTVPGLLQVQGDLTLRTPLLTGAKAADQTLSATGALSAGSGQTPAAPTTETGLGAKLTLVGASVTTAGEIRLPSGQIVLEATTGNLDVGGRLDASGTARNFVDVVKYTDAGAITLKADAGSVSLTKDAVVSVAAAAGGGDAGMLSVAAPKGDVEFPLQTAATSASAAGATVAAPGILPGLFLGQAGKDGMGGSFQLDVGTIDSPTFAALQAALDADGFSASREARVRFGDLSVTGLATAHTYSLATDHGSIDVLGTIDASGQRGGSIDLLAGGSVVLDPTAVLTVAALEHDAAGKGGRVSLEAGSYVDKVPAAGAAVTIQSGATIDLTVAEENKTDTDLGWRSGTLHLRAPQSGNGSEVAVGSLPAGVIVGASSVVVEAVKVFDLTPAKAGSVAITTTNETAVKTYGTALGNNAGAIRARLLASGAVAPEVLHVQPGVELVNRNGDLTLDHPWDLSTFRSGATDPAVLGSGEPGTLTLRTSGNLVFGYNATKKTLGSLSDGFGGASTYGLWDQQLLAPGVRSWSYRLVAGADFAAANFRDVTASTGTTGSIQIGKGSPALPTAKAQSRSVIVSGLFQTIRTGTGDIDLRASWDVQLLNNLATIYTAGTQVANDLAGFDRPYAGFQPFAKLGPTSAPYSIGQYAVAGGNVTIEAGHDLAHKTAAGAADSSKEMPNNWLYRRGEVDPATGQFVVRTNIVGEQESFSTTWWVDYSNFFEGVGALGGGNVALTAGHDIANVDAVVPTNARMPGGTPDATKLVELGGGDLSVRAGGAIDGGVYYVERGNGALVAGGAIKTNNTRVALAQKDAKPTSAPTTWLPTTLFLGKGTFDLRANSDLLLGSVANPFLLPEGVYNGYQYRSYFDTYAADSAVRVSSLTGTVTLRNTPTGNVGSLWSWFKNVLRYDSPNATTWSGSQPWLSLDESNLEPFVTASSLMPSTLSATAFSGDIDIAGKFSLSPAPRGGLELLAAGAIGGFQVVNNGAGNLPTGDRTWASSLINLSDADPARFPSVAAPLTGGTTTATGGFVQASATLMAGFDSLLKESGSSTGNYGVLQTKQALHKTGLLHAEDTEPVRLYALEGDISGLTLYSGKETRVLAGQDITDIGLYVQNNRVTDVSVVAAGRDIVAYDPNSALRTQAQGPGNFPLVNTGMVPATSSPTAGDIQISGPGTIEVLAGRNLDLGVGPNANDGTGVGLVSIGNARNPSLPFAGADIVAAAGIGEASSLASSTLERASLVDAFLNPATAGAQAARYLPKLGVLLELGSVANDQIWTAFAALPAEEQAQRAIDLFYLVLRDAGRDYNDPASPHYRDKAYVDGFAAIGKLFPGHLWKGDISLTSREIKTFNGGDISLLAPGGKLTVGLNVSGTHALDQGILTEHGGAISIFTHGSVIVGTSRIFTLRGGNETIWSSMGDIAAGSSSKTVQSAPPTRVLIDPQSGDVKTDLAGLATGGGIGVLATVKDVPPGDIDLVAPVGTIDAGDAGIRSSGNLNIASLHVANAANIATGGTSAGVPALAAPSLGGVVAAASTSGMGSTKAPSSVDPTATTRDVLQSGAMPSLIQVEVIGYGGADDEEEAKRKEGDPDATQGEGGIDQAAASASPEG